MVAALEGTVLFPHSQRLDPAEGPFDLLVQAPLGLAREKNLGGAVRARIGGQLDPGASRRRKALGLAAEAQEALERQARDLAIQGDHPAAAQIVQPVEPRLVVEIEPKPAQERFEDFEIEIVGSRSRDDLLFGQEEISHRGHNHYSIVETRAGFSIPGIAKVW
jgi:hypothetical protein